MKSTIIAVSNEVKCFSNEDLEKAKTFSGKNAGICYMADNYFNSSVSDSIKASQRFPRVAGTNHHSIADHVRVEVLFEGISKMLAIVLNSLQDYSTSEKSGRYTEMTASSEKEQFLYDKWRNLFHKRIGELYPDLDEKSTDKLAQENARYVLSVFTRSTTMGYSTSLRQWNYIYDWCKKYMSQFSYVLYPLESPDSTEVLYNNSLNTIASYFEVELYKDIEKLADFIEKNLYVDVLRDPRKRCFDFLVNNSGDENHPMRYYHIVEPDMINGFRGLSHSEDDYLGITYSVSYPASFVQIAQAERHRTLKYFMQFNSHCSIKDFYIPKCIRGTHLENDWLDDLNSIKDLVPQATIVGIIETGHIGDFVMKCQERLCGRAQLEVAEQTRNTALRFIDASSNSRVLSEYTKKFQFCEDVKLKCKMLGGCKEPCRWVKSNEVFSRLI